jgi:hypothetical protein
MLVVYRLRITDPAVYSSTTWMSMNTTQATVNLLFLGVLLTIFGFLRLIRGGNPIFQNEYPIY